MLNTQTHRCVVGGERNRTSLWTWASLSETFNASPRILCGTPYPHLPPL
nr:MAG TPA: hypothetical protein [Caudoviricetes sp.]